MEAAHTSETSVSTYKTTWYKNLEGHNLNTHDESLKT
jgi:hypothetical protein